MISSLSFFFDIDFEYKTQKDKNTIMFIYLEEKYIVLTDIKYNIHTLITIVNNIWKHSGGLERDPRKRLCLN